MPLLHQILLRKNQDSELHQSSHMPAPDPYRKFRLSLEQCGEDKIHLHLIQYLLPYRFWGSSARIRVIPGSVPRRRDNMLQGWPQNYLAGHSAGKGCLSGICRGRKTQNQYSSRLCRESTCFHGIAVPLYWFHSYIFEIVTIVVYWFCGRGKRPVPTVESWRCSLMPQCFGRPFS